MLEAITRYGFEEEYGGLDMYEVGSLAYVVRNGVTVQKCHVTRAEDDMRIVELESGALSMLRITELYPTYESADTSIPQEEDGRKGVPA